MKILVSVVAALLFCGVAFAESNTPNKTTIDFDKTSVGQLPDGWVGGVTGQGAPKWSVEVDTTAPSQQNALKQSGSGTYPWCVKKDISLKDGYIEVKFKPISGNEDQAGGLIWRWQDGDNYYITRANALEDNVTIYHIVKGSRRAFKNINMKVTSNQWHTLRVDFVGNKFRVTFDGKVVIEAVDDTFKEPGAVGVWTKADSVTLFDNFSFGETK